MLPSHGTDIEIENEFQFHFDISKQHHSRPQKVFNRRNPLPDGQLLH